jgi:hypothetical protein
MPNATGRLSGHLMFLPERGAVHDAYAPICSPAIIEQVAKDHFSYLPHKGDFVTIDAISHSFSPVSANTLGQEIVGYVRSVFFNFVELQLGGSITLPTPLWGRLNIHQGGGFSPAPAALNLERLAAPVIGYGCRGILNLPTICPVLEALPQEELGMRYSVLPLVTGGANIPSVQATAALAPIWYTYAPSVEGGALIVRNTDPNGAAQNPSLIVGTFDLSEPTINPVPVATLSFYLDAFAPEAGGAVQLIPLDFSIPAANIPQIAGNGSENYQTGIFVGLGLLDTSMEILGLYLNSGIIDVATNGTTTIV